MYLGHQSTQASDTAQQMEAAVITLKGNCHFIHIHCCGVSMDKVPCNVLCDSCG